MIAWIFKFLTPIVTMLLSLGMAGFVLSRNWRAWVNRCLAFALLTQVVHLVSLLASDLTENVDWQRAILRVGLGVAVILPPTWLAFSLRFGENNGGCRLARWRPAIFALTLAVPVTWIALATGRVIQLFYVRDMRLLRVGLDAWGRGYFFIYVVGLVIVLFHLENLYRSAAPLTRWKIKFLVIGLFIVLGFQSMAASHALLYGFIHPAYPVLSELAYLVGTGMIAFSLVRHRLLDVDIFVSRYVVYQSLTLALVGGYLLSLGVVAEIFRWLNIALDALTGTFFAMMGALAVALLLLSGNIRRKAKSFIHAHFYNHKYDYRQEWTEFTRRLSTSIAVPEIATQTVNRILEVMWIRQAAIYMAGEGPGHMILSYQVQYTELPSAVTLPISACALLRHQARLIPSAGSMDPLPDPANDLAKDIVPGVPVGCLVPIAALDNLVGLLVVGPELSGKPFGIDDRDLLAAVAAQAGALMVNARLSQEAAEGRELQALARLSAFVVHDLKNAVSMLSLLTENTKQHMANPAFQTDAIRTLSDVTSKMRSLMAILSSPGVKAVAPSQSLGLAPSVHTWMREIGSQVPSRIRVQTRLNSTSRVRVDPDQLRSVLDNLVLNAIEATSGEGAILVETADEDGYAMLTVTDTGRGMTQEFIRERLFRPFQTTKSRGLGIGLYQARHIVQSFGGCITAESQVGKGTRIVIKLPTVLIPSHGIALDAPKWAPEVAVNTRDGTR